MSKKKLEVVELNKKEEEIVLEEKKSRFAIFFKNNRLLILITTIILALTILVCSVILTVSYLKASEEPILTNTTVDTDLTDYMATIDDVNGAMTDDIATTTFFNNSSLKKSGEALVTKKLENGKFIVKYFSDGTAIKIMKDGSLITRINPLEDGSYGISENGNILTSAKSFDVTIEKTKKYAWGTVTYYSDGSAEITDSKEDLFVRNSKDIYDNYISDNKVSYLKETKTIGSSTINYYYDGTIEIVKNNTSYLLRNENDLEISGNDITFKNDNQATIYKTTNLSDGLIIDYYTDGGAIIKNGSKTLSVRKSNSIIIQNNKLYEIIDNIYVDISYQKKDVTYYTNGGAIANYNNETYYVEENSNVKYQDDTITDIEKEKETLQSDKEKDNNWAKAFEKHAVVKLDDKYAIIPKENVIYDTDGNFLDILISSSDDELKTFTIKNNTNETIHYRVVIQKSNRTTIDVSYIRYQMTAGEIYVSPTKLNNQIWTKDNLTNLFNPTGTNYILLDSKVKPSQQDDVNIMLWLDYETIPNTMQNKYFYGTIKVYAWTEN